MKATFLRFMSPIKISDICIRLKLSSHSQATLSLFCWDSKAQRGNYEWSIDWNKNIRERFVTTPLMWYLGEKSTFGIKKLQWNMTYWYIENANANLK